MRLSATLIVKNEERNLHECLSRLRFADEIIVVDSGSSDCTVEIAKQFTPFVFSRPFDDFSSQKNFAISKAKGNWVFSIDADERVSEELAKEIVETTRNPDGLEGYRIKRHTYFLGRLMRYSGMQSDWPLRLFKKEMGRFEQPIHEFVKLNGRTGNLKNVLTHYTTPSIQKEIDKTDFYTNLEAQFLYDHNRSAGSLSMYLKSCLIFLDRYTIKLGFLDGKEGFLFAYYAARYNLHKYKKLMRLCGARKLEYLIKKRFDSDGHCLPDSIDPNDSRLRALIQALNPVQDKLILDLGCGKGRFARVISQDGGRVVGIDPSESLIQTATKFSAVKFLQGSASELPFADNTFDLVYAVEVIEHLPALQNSIQEMVRVLKKQGKLVLIDRHLFSLSQKRPFVPNLFIKAWHEIKNDWFYPRSFPFREHWFSKNHILRFMQDCGLDARAYHVQSDGEKNCKWHWIFDSFPFFRIFIFWEGIKK